MKIVLQAQLLKVESRSDKTWKLQFNTQEISGQEAAELLNKVMEEVYLVVMTEEELKNVRTNRN